MIDKISLSLLIVFFSFKSAFSDSIFLKDGKKIDGKIVEQSEGQVKIMVAGTELQFLRDEIESLEIKPEEALPVPVIPDIERKAPENQGPAQAEETAVNQDNESAPAANINKDSLDVDIDKDPEKLLQLVLELSGIKKYIQDIPAAITAQLLQRREELDQGVYEQADKIIKESFSADELYGQLFKVTLNRLKNNKPDRIRFWSLLKSLRDPLLTKIIQEQKNADSSKAAEERAYFIANLEKYQPNQDRVNLLMVVDAATARSTFAIKMQTKALREMMNVVNLCLAPEKRSSPEAIDSAVRKMQGKLQAAAKNSALINMLFIYRNISDEELKAYIKFYDSDNAKWILTATDGNLGRAWGFAAEKAIKVAAQLSSAEKPETRVE